MPGARFPKPRSRSWPTTTSIRNSGRLSNQSSGCCVDAAQDGLLLRVTLQEVRHADDTTSFETILSYVPTRVDRTDFTIVPVVDALELDGLSALSERELERTRARTAEVLGRLADDSWVLVEQEAVLEADSDS